MDLLSAANHRVSRRSYRHEPIEPEDWEALKTYIDAINDQSGLSFSLLEDGGPAFFGYKSYGMFSGVRSLLLLKGADSDVHLEEKAGYYGEMAVLYATTLGLGTCWVAGTFDRDSKAFNIPKEERLVAVVPVGKVKERMTVKEKAMYTLIHRHTKPVSELLKADGRPPEWVLSALESVQRAPSARNSQRVSFSYSKGELSASVPGGHFTDLIDLGIAKLHFELAAGGRFDWGSGGAYHPVQ